ncbi:MAG: D-alanyl-D-alanine carboxypeptidase/D-alanyl-D-alanine-endopeptidase [Chitinophagaceae bacterium]|jgi:D-alanyl-D-alanine carboxypeptidase/D-alanyl-D-alanine-endopeptidase (penicillin-binding protein 4)|nr:D-alanyl-D-alanine carboxypeptidase/D-alanyl-D-alanine-endopeptidase [Chitinophagaceae bacterium]
MKKVCLFAFVLLNMAQAGAQTVTSKLEKAYAVFEKDEQLKFASASLYVINAKTGAVVFDKNSQVGLSPASTQKVITAASAMALLGPEFRYETNFYNALSIQSPAENNLLVIGSGDPSFGSWRYTATKEEQVFKQVANAVKEKNITGFNGSVIVNDFLIDHEGIPNGYNWVDIGNYYGAGHYRLNWRENQYDIAFKTGEKGLSEIASVKPAIPGVVFDNQVTAGKKGSGDNAYIYFKPGSEKMVIRGTVPPNEKAFTISGAVPDPSKFFATQLMEYFNQPSIQLPVKNGYQPKKLNNAETREDDFSIYKLEPVYTHRSPALDSIVYWFMRRSINLYGEALVKTIALHYKQKPSMENGLKFLTDFWKTQGIQDHELNMYDGSGLSPSNRVTTKAQVAVLSFAREQKWFNQYKNAFPEFNGMKMKSGTIADVKGFAGYHTSKNGTEYIFSFLVNNYSGTSSALVQKMYKVLNEIK